MSAGEQIGHTGATGNVSGPHLHIEVQRAAQWKQGNYVDPQPWVDARKDEPVNIYDYDYLEKPGGTQEIGRNWEKLDQSAWTPNRSGVEFTFAYMRITPRFKSGKHAGAVQVRVMRENGDAHAPASIPVHIDMLEDDGTYPDTFLTFELGEDGGSTHVEVRCVGGIESALTLCHL